MLRIPSDGEKKIVLHDLKNLDDRSKIGARREEGTKERWKMEKEDR